MSISELIRKERATRKNSQLTTARGCHQNGPAAALLVGHVSIQICSAPRALPAAYFDRNESHVSYGTGHLGLF